jgi:hypothetical protein
MLYFHFLLFGSVALRAATVKTLDHDLIYRKHYFNLFSFIFASSKKDPERDADGQSAFWGFSSADAIAWAFV